MRLKQAIADALNHHITVESTSAFAYLSMASWCDVRGLNGFASYFRGEADGEFQHMHRFVRYLNDMDVHAVFETVPAPQHDWSNLAEMTEQAYQMEVELTKAINQLVAVTREHQDYFSESFLHGFIPSQIEDTAKSDDIRQRVALAGQGEGLLVLDQELGSTGTPRG